MFVDELTINAKAGRGGNGVVRWLRQRHRPLGGPAGGNGGKGGDVYVRAVRDLSLLSKYSGEKEFAAENGGHGQSTSRHGKDGNDLYIEVPVGSLVTNTTNGRQHELQNEGDTEKILKGGQGGLGNEYFKSSTNRSPQESTPGKAGDTGTFLIELELVVDVGFIGLPNAGKSTLLNLLTNAKSQVGDYPFTTLEPHLGDFYGYILADIPGLISGAAEGKGLGHKFLRHIKRTKMLLHVVSCENDDVIDAYQTVRTELRSYDQGITEKEEWVVLSKTDSLSPHDVENKLKELQSVSGVVHAVSMYDDSSIKEFSNYLTDTLRGGDKPATI